MKWPWSKKYVYELQKHLGRGSWNKISEYPAVVTPDEVLVDQAPGTYRLIPRDEKKGVYAESVWSTRISPPQTEAPSLHEGSGAEMVKTYIKETLAPVGELAGVLADALKGVMALAQVLNPLYPGTPGNPGGNPSMLPGSPEDQLIAVFDRYGKVTAAAQKLLGGTAGASPGPNWPTFSGTLPAYFHPYVITYVDSTIRGIIDYGVEKAKELGQIPSGQIPGASSLQVGLQPSLNVEEYTQKTQAAEKETVRRAKVSVKEVEPEKPAQPLASTKKTEVAPRKQEAETDIEEEGEEGAEEYGAD